MSATGAADHVTSQTGTYGMAHTKPAITVRVPAPLHEYLTEMAWQQRRSRSELCAEILHAFVERSAGDLS